MTKQDEVRRNPATLEYIQSMLHQLRGMAKDQGCPMAAYLIEMAYLDVSEKQEDAEGRLIRKSIA